MKLASRVVVEMTTDADDEQAAIDALLSGFIDPSVWKVIDVRLMSVPRLQPPSRLSVLTDDTLTAEQATALELFCAEAAR